MHMVMVLIANRRYFTHLILANWLNSTIVTVLMAVMPKMCGMIRRVLQHIANARCCRIGSVQREHDGKNKREASTHIGRSI